MHELLFNVPYDVGPECDTVLSLKRIAALPGDEVNVLDQEITSPLSTVYALRKRYDGARLPVLATGTHVVPTGYVWLINDYHANSADSRYYGGVSIRAIVRRAEPILAFSMKSND